MVERSGWLKEVESWLCVPPPALKHHRLHRTVLPVPCTAVPQEPLSLPFLKKYIAFAKQRFAAPELTPEASDAIAGGWPHWLLLLTAL